MQQLINGQKGNWQLVQDVILQSQRHISSGLLITMNIKPGSLSFPHAPLPLFSPGFLISSPTESPHFLFTALFTPFPSSRASSRLSGIAQMQEQWPAKSHGGLYQPDCV